MPTLPLRLYPGMNEQHSLVTKKTTHAAGHAIIRHDSESGVVGRQGGKARDDSGRCCRRRHSRRLAQANGDGHGAGSRVLRGDLTA
jgi:hypothetical protein